MAHGFERVVSLLIDPDLQTLQGKLVLFEMTDVKTVQWK